MQGVDQNPETHSIWIDLRPNLIILFVVFEGELGVLKNPFYSVLLVLVSYLLQFFCLNQDWLAFFLQKHTLLYEGWARGNYDGQNLVFLHHLFMHKRLQFYVNLMTQLSNCCCFLSLESAR